MHITDVERTEDLYPIVIQSLRSMGVKHRTKKINKKVQENRKDGTFNKALNCLPLHTVKLENGSKLYVPQLVHELCSYISCSLETEGLFRKAGSTGRQKEIKFLLESGCELSSEHHVIDVANVLKGFLRNLPEPLIPHMYQDTFLQCLLTKKGESVKAILSACLLLPTLHLHTLYYFMEFLHRVGQYSKFNKMDTKNIAIVMTPTVMPIEDKVITYVGNSRLSHHVQVIQILLENAEKIGEIPPDIAESLHLPNSANPEEEELKRKKKRRSGSLTRMFHGLKRMVSSKSGEEVNKQMASATPDLLLTPCLTKSGKKRKVFQSTGFSTKRRRELLETLPQASALVNTPFKPGQTPVCHHPKPEEIQTPHLPIPEMKIAPLSDEFVRIPKSEYEEIKSRVSAIEDRISQELNCVQATTSSSHVQTVYEKTLEEVENLTSPTTEQLAKRLSRELKIRRSADHKVIRSPSARKIGSIRRRSQEGIAKITRNQSCHIPRVTLKRGRPNTVMSGLPQPSPIKSVDVGRSSSFHSHTPNSSEENSNLEKWASAEMFFKKVEKPKTPISVEQHRESLAKLRSQNAGMVLAKAKLFDELSDSGASNNSQEIVKSQPRRPVRRGGTFPRQNPAVRRQRAFDHSAEKENEVKKPWEGSRVTKSPRRIKPIRVMRQ